MKIAILHDQILEGASQDEMDTLVQAETIFKALADLGHEPLLRPFSPDLDLMAKTLRQIKPDLVFNLMESVHGVGQLICLAPTLLEVIGQPYTGSNADSLFLTSNKLLTKKLLALADIPTPPWVSPEKDSTWSPDSSYYPSHPGYPGYPGHSGQPKAIPLNQTYLLKLVWEHASIGLDNSSLILPNSKEDILKALEERQKKFCKACFAEAYIDGRELNISLLEGKTGPEIMPPAEIVYHDYPADKLKILDYKAKWEEDSFEYQHTVRSFVFSEQDVPILHAAQEIALTCWELFQLQGYARVDFRIDQNGKPWVLEINANPCLSPNSGFVAAASQAGYSFQQVIEKILAASIPNSITL